MKIKWGKWASRARPIFEEKREDWIKDLYSSAQLYGEASLLVGDSMVIVSRQPNGRMIAFDCLVRRVASVEQE